MINIKCFGKRKDNATTTSTTSNTGYSNNTQSVNVNGVYLWGQYHDHNNDVDGDITTSGSISAQGNITTPSDISGANLTLSGNLTAEGDISCNDINSTGDIRTTDTYSANITNTNNITTNSITANEGTITTLVADFLTVTKQAHFFELVIDKIKSNAGQVILSAANATIDKVSQVTGGYKLWWRREDPETHKKIANDFAVNDQIRCQTFNVEVGSNNEVANKYYWMLVTQTGRQMTQLDDELTECNYIEVSDTDKDGTSIPEVGDEIVQLGNRTDTSRQNAIILSACASLDPNVQAPSIVQYKNINSYTLNGKIYNQIAANGNNFTGNFQVITGNTTTDVKDLVNGDLPNIVTDSDAVFVMADSSSKIYAITDAQALVTDIQLYEGSTQIDSSNWDLTNSYIKNGTQSAVNFNGQTITGTGLYITSATVNNNGGVTITWGFAGSYPSGDYTITSHNILINIEYTFNNATKTVQKSIPMNVIKGGSTVAGADAEFDQLRVLNSDLIVQIGDVLTMNATAEVWHIKGDTSTKITNLSNYRCSIVLNNGSHYSLTASNGQFIISQTIGGYSSLQNPPTSGRLELWEQGGGTSTLVSTYVVVVTFNAGAIFTVKNDAITAAVQQSNNYTDGQIATVNLTAQGLNTRVTAIENDYVTSSELNQTANQITLNVYDELRNRTGIDIQQGTITLNANNTTINGNLNLTNADNGITIYDSDGTARIQLQPENIGNIDNFDAGTSYQVRSTLTTSNQSTYSLTTDKKKIGYFNATDTMTMTNIKCFIKSWTGQTYDIPTSTITAAIKIYREGNNTALRTVNKTFTYNASTGEHTTSDISYTIPNDGVYLFNATFTYTATTPLTNIYEEVFCNVNQTIQHQTYIGADGMYCNPYHNAMLWAGSDAIVMRWENEGIRVDNEALKRVPVHTTLTEPEYLPFDNYTRVTTLNSNQYTLYNTEYRYTIQPLYDYGIIASACPSYNTSGRTTHIILPSFSFYSIGTQYTLPTGYTVRVVNTDAINHTGTMTSNKYIYVDAPDIQNTWQVSGKVMTFVHISAGLWTVYDN